MISPEHCIHSRLKRDFTDKTVNEAKSKHMVDKNILILYHSPKISSNSHFRVN